MLEEIKNDDVKSCIIYEMCIKEKCNSISINTYPVLEPVVIVFIYCKFKLFIMQHFQTVL